MTYAPQQPPGKLDDLPWYIILELEAISRWLSEQKSVELRPSHAPPLKPRTGMVIYADGIDWNPGNGAGLYYWNGSTWVSLVPGAGGTIVSVDITDSTAAGRAILTASTHAAQVALLPASSILTQILTVDGSGSGLDADTIDGVEPANLSLDGGNF